MRFVPSVLLWILYILEIIFILLNLYADLLLSIDVILNKFENNLLIAIFTNNCICW